jgi:lysyl-tRNA synthetase class I
VFAAVSDINLPARFSNEFKGGRWLDQDTPIGVGSRFAGRNEHPAAGEWETTCTVVEYDPPCVFAYSVAGMDGDVAATWRFTVASEGTGSRLTQWMQMGPGRSILNFAIESMPEKESRILNRRLREHRQNMEANLAGVKQFLEVPS